MTDGWLDMCTDIQVTEGQTDRGTDIFRVLYGGGVESADTDIADCG